jgi:hypothetical protein
VWHTPIAQLPPDVAEARRAKQREHRNNWYAKKKAGKQQTATAEGQGPEKVEVTDQTEPLFLRPTGE